MNNVRSISLLLVLLVATAGLVGCGGGGAKVESNSTTMGQELTDLKNAYDQGIISEKEYEKSREKILKRYN